MGVVLRFASEADASAIAHVHAASWRAAYRGLVPEAELDRLDPRLLSHAWARRLGNPREGVAWVAVDDVHGVIGFATAHAARRARGFEGRAAEIGWLYVSPTHVGRGIGSALLRRAFDALEKSGVMWAAVSVLESNRDARRFYERHGLRLGPDRWRDPRLGVPVVVYERPLNRVFDFAALRQPARTAGP